MSDAADNPFDLLGVEPRFDLDDRLLRERYLAASSATHPDRFSDPIEQADAAQRASAINAAYRTLGDPEARAIALLRLRTGGKPLAEVALPADLLMQMMEVREELEQAAAEQDQVALERLRQWATQQRQDRLAALAEHFGGTGTGEVSVEAVQQELAALRYVQRMLDQMPH